MATSSHVIPLPGAASAPVVQHPRRGRFPRVVTPLKAARDMRAMRAAADHYMRPAQDERGGVAAAETRPDPQNVPAHLARLQML